MIDTIVKIAKNMIVAGFTVPLYLADRIKFNMGEP